MHYSHMVSGWYICGDQCDVLNFADFLKHAQYYLPPISLLVQNIFSYFSICPLGFMLGSRAIFG